jgi:uncharacterized membrane-anchored protein
MQALILCILTLATVFSGSIVGAEEATQQLSWQTGPTEVKLGDQAILSLPAGYRFLGAQQTQEVLKQMGNIPSGEEFGLITSAQEQDWFVIVRYVDSGYVKDDDAASWNADEMYTAIKEGTEQDNKQREAQGFPALVLRGWEEKPHYDQQAHKVVWALSHVVKEDVGVNYNTLALGRYGYMSMNMVGSLGELPELKPHVQTLLTNMNFVEGKRYANFNSTTDQVAAVGLSALIAGAAFKSGLLAKLWAFLIPVVIMAKKLIVFIVIAIGTMLTRWFRKKPAVQPVTPA